ncbi:MAG TPA: hypothetical protein VND87_16330 [Stellaceae bacterium]|nr:hypothetical protein [Stellaceae bacterium]
MFHESFGPLSFDENVLVARINLCCAALGLVIFALLAGSCTWPVRSLALVVASGLVLLARQIGPMLRRSRAFGEREDRSEPCDHYLLPF